MTNWGQVKKSEPVKYTVPVGIKKGSDTIEIENPESLGFKIGQIIEIGNKETRTIVGFGKSGSLILDKPLEYDYSENTIISVIDEPKKKILQLISVRYIMKTSRVRNVTIYIILKTIYVRYIKQNVEKMNG